LTAVAFSSSSSSLSDMVSEDATDFSGDGTMASLEDVMTLSDSLSLSSYSSWLLLPPVVVTL